MCLYVVGSSKVSFWDRTKRAKVEWHRVASHCKNLRGLWGWPPRWIFTRASRIFAAFLHWQHQLLLICTHKISLSLSHATLFRHRAHIRLWLHSQNKWASLRRHKLTGEAVVKMEIWNSLFTLALDSLKTNFQPINYCGVVFLHLSPSDK